MSNVVPGRFGTNQPIPDRDDRDWVTSQEVVAEAGITYRQLDYWTRTGLLQASGDRPGNGTLRRYPAAQLTRAQVLGDLVNIGVSLQTCRRVIDQILTDGRVAIGPVTIICHRPGVAS